MATIEELDAAIAAGKNPEELRSKKARVVPPVDTTGSSSTVVSIEELDARLAAGKNPINPTLDDDDDIIFEEPEGVTGGGVESDEPLRIDGALVPTAYNPEDEVVVEEEEAYDDSYRSGFDRTSAAWQGWTASLRDEEGEVLSDEDVQVKGNEISDALLEENAFRDVDPTSAAMAGLFRQFPKTMLHTLNMLQVAGSAGIDILEYALESDKEVGEQLDMGVNGYTLTEAAINNLSGVSGSSEVETPAQVADFIGETILGSMEFFETLGAVGVPSKVFSVINKIPSVEAGATVKKVRRDAADLKKALRNNAEIARGASSRTRTAAVTLAQEVAEQNKSIRDDLILEFEANLTGESKKISKQVGDHLELDDELVGASARETLREPFKPTPDGSGDASLAQDTLAGLVGADGGLLSPVYNPDKLNALTAVVSVYKNKTKGLKVDPFTDPKNSKKKTMEILLDLTINKDLAATEELIDVLNTYGISFEDFVLGSVGSFSDAGRVLSIASQIKRLRPAGDLDAARAKKLAELEAGISNVGNRIEGARRGMLVGKFATAMRNIESFGARVPMESIMNIIDGVTRSFNDPIELGKDAKGGFLGATKTLLSKDLWKDSFGTFKYAFSRPDVADAYMRLMLEQPQFREQWVKMYENLNEIQKASGRGSGTKVDAVLSEVENVVEMFNTANRWQETMTRNAVAMGELERLVRIEYKIDLIDALQDGKLPDLLNDASSVRPEGARSFSAIMSDATERALAVTYGAPPEGKMLKSITSFLTTNKIGPVPLTVFVEFPRFMFSSMEYMAQSTYGAAGPLIKKAVGIHKGPLTPRQQRAIQRNLTGAAAISAAYMYRSSENAPAKFEDVRLAGKDIDTTTQFPIRQFMYLGETVKQIKQGTWGEFWDPKVFAETFIGQAFRTGSGNIFIEEMAAIADGLDVSGGIKAAEIAGKQVSDYMTTFFVPLSQFADIQRGIPINESGQTWRPNAYTDNPEPAPESALEAGTREISKGFKRMGFGVGPQTESAFDTRETVFESDAERPDASWKTALGISVKELASEDEEWVTNLQIPTWQIGSNSDIDTVKMFENKIIAERLPSIIDMIQSREEKLRRQYRRKKPENITEEAYILYNTKPLFVSALSSLKTQIKKVSGTKADDFSRLTSTYNRIPKQFRQMAWVNLTADLKGDEELDVTDKATLRKLINRATVSQNQVRKATR
tara:strand:+ start:657 stop:4265 length:3609 start_codon:yes stop_codon:yes gene_type:complete